MSNDIIIRSYRKNDEKKIVDLLINSFESWQKKKAPLEYWKWIYLNSPNKPYIQIAEAGNQIVSVSHDLNIQIKIGEEVLSCTFAGDTTTHKDFRGQGIHSQIISFKEENKRKTGIKFGYSISSNPIILKYQAKRGYMPFPHTLSYYVRIIDTKVHLKNRPIENSLLAKYGYNTVKYMNKLKNPFSTKTKNHSGFSKEPFTIFNEEFDIFWNKVKGSHEFVVEKTSCFLNWRYSDPSAESHAFIKAVHNDVILGFIALKIMNVDGYAEGYIMDIIVDQKRADVFDSLISSACDFFDSNNVNVIYCLTSAKIWYKRILNSYGFIDSMRKPNIGCYIGDEKLFEILKLADIDKISFNYAEICARARAQLNQSVIARQIISR
jgi:hypothetical protein